MDEPLNTDYLVKIIIVGDTNVGKTSILKKFIHNRFEFQFDTTIGVDFEQEMMSINDKNFNIHIWDTAGSERYKSITKSYYNNAHGVIIVFDITNYDSFNNVIDWFNDINKLCIKNIPIILVGNKSDLEEKRRVSHKEIVELTTKLNINYIEVSAKRGKNIEKIFKNLIKKVSLIVDLPKQIYYIEQEENTGCCTIM